MGKILADKLGIPFYDKQLLYKAAADAGMNPELFVNNDERVPKYINSSISFSFGVNPMPWYNGSTAISDENLYRAQSDFIHKLVDEGPCVIVGRSADYVLRDRQRIVNVFVHAHIDDCVKRIIKRSDCVDAAKARKMAEKINRLRANYYNFYTDKKWGDAASYDLTFNSSLMPMEDIADIIIEYINRRFSLAESIGR